MTNETVLPGAEPFLFEGSDDVGVLISHGFTGSPQSMRYVGEQLNRLGGYTVLGPRLAGHGISPEAMDKTNAQDWVNTIDENLTALRQRCKRLFMVGLSMGGCLTLLSAARHPDIRGIVPINACVFLEAPTLAALSFDVNAPRFIPGIGSDIKQAGVTELAYKEVPVSGVREIYRLMGATRDLLSSIKCPTLVLTSTEDHVVTPRNGEFIVSHVGAQDRQLVWLKDSYHVATLDNDKDLIVQQTLDFIRRLTA